MPEYFNHNAFFQEEPRKYTGELYSTQDANHPAPDYVITCYESYPLVKQISTALFHKKALGFRHSQAFSLCDCGAIASLAAFRWMQATGKSAVIICVEETYDLEASWSGGYGYPRSDAATLFQLSPDNGDFGVCAFIQRQVQGPKGVAVSVEALFNESRRMIEDMLAETGISAEDVLILPHCLSEYYETQMRVTFPLVYLRDCKQNLATADPYYSLQEACNRIRPFPPYIMLNFADPKGLVGIVLLSSCVNNPNNEVI